MPAFVDIAVVAKETSHSPKEPSLGLMNFGQGSVAWGQSEGLAGLAMGVGVMGWVGRELVGDGVVILRFSQELVFPSLFFSGGVLLCLKFPIFQYFIIILKQLPDFSFA